VTVNGNVVFTNSQTAACFLLFGTRVEILGDVTVQNVHFIGEVVLFDAEVGGSLFFGGNVLFDSLTVVGAAGIFGMLNSFLLNTTLVHTPTVAAADGATMTTKGTFTVSNINLNITGSGPGLKPNLGNYFVKLMCDFTGAIAALLTGGVWQAEGAVLFQNIYGLFPGSITPSFPSETCESHVRVLSSRIVGGAGYLPA